jgi:hypothetical protein
MNPGPASADESPDLPWTVYVDDNFHYMDESERVSRGHFATLEEAIAVCIAITRNSVEENGDAYWNFGDDPWVMPRPEPEVLAAALAAHPEWPREAFANGYFSAKTYASLLVNGKCQDDWTPRRTQD